MCSGSVDMALYKIQEHPDAITPCQSRVPRRLTINHTVRYNVWNSWTFEHRKGYSKPRKKSCRRYNQSRYPENEVCPYSSDSTEEGVRTSQSNSRSMRCSRCIFREVKQVSASASRRRIVVDKAIRRSLRHPHQLPQVLPLTVAVAAGGKGAVVHAAIHQEVGAVLRPRALLYRR